MFCSNVQINTEKIGLIYTLSIKLISFSCLRIRTINVDRSQVECWMTECYTNGCQVINMLLQISQQWLYMSISYKVPALGGYYTCKKRHQIQKMQRESNLPEISDAEACVYAGQQ